MARIPNKRMLFHHTRFSSCQGVFKPIAPLDQSLSICSSPSGSQATDLSCFRYKVNFIFRSSSSPMSKRSPSDSALSKKYLLSPFRLVVSVPDLYFSPSFPFLVSLISRKKNCNISLVICFVTVESLNDFPYRCICQVIGRRNAVLVPLFVLKAFCIFAKSSISFSSNGTVIAVRSRSDVTKVKSHFETQ